MLYKHKLFIEESAHSAVIVGDLHLYPGANKSAACDLERLADSVDEKGLLVLNGDVFDLDRIGNEQAFGMAHGAAARRVVRFLEEFPAVERSITSWIEGGGKVVWLAGNHDAEICLQDVQEAVWNHLGVDESSLCFGDRLVLNGEIVVEHGHRFDPDNCMYPTTAAAVRRGNLESLPMGSLLTRMLLTKIPEYERNGEHRASPWQVFRVLLRKHGISVFKMVWLYLLTAVKICILSSRAAYRADTAPWSSTNGAFAASRRLYLDRLLAALFLVAFGTTCLFAWLAGADVYAYSLLTLSALPASYLLFPPKRVKSYESRDVETVRSHAKRLAKDISLDDADTGSINVVMGHTHLPENMVLDQSRGSVYVNHGSFSRTVNGKRPLVIYNGQSLDLAYFPPYPKLESVKVA